MLARVSTCEHSCAIKMQGARKPESKCDKNKIVCNDTGAFLEQKNPKTPNSDTGNLYFLTNYLSNIIGYESVFRK